MRVKLTNTQLNKLKSAAKNMTETILRRNNKNCKDEELLHELFLITRQTTKIRNTFANNMSIDKKLSKAQTSKIIQSGGSFGSWLGDFATHKKSTNECCYSLSLRQFTWSSKQFSFKCNKLI